VGLELSFKKRYKKDLVPGRLISIFAESVGNDKRDAVRRRPCKAIIFTTIKNPL
jgi:hypothetical protein